MINNEHNLPGNIAQQLQQEGKQGADHPWGVYGGNHEGDNEWYFPYYKFLNMLVHGEEQQTSYKNHSDKPKTIE